MRFPVLILLAIVAGVYSMNDTYINLADIPSGMKCDFVALRNDDMTVVAYSISCEDIDDSDYWDIFLLCDVLFLLGLIPLYLLLISCKLEDIKKNTKPKESIV